MSNFETSRRGFLGLLGAAVAIPSIPLNLAAPAEAAVTSTAAPEPLAVGKWCLSVADDRGRWRYLLGLTEGQICQHLPTVETDYVLGSPPVRIPRPFAPRETSIDATGYTPNLAMLDRLRSDELMLGLKRYRLDLGDRAGAYELDAFLNAAEFQMQPGTWSPGHGPCIVSLSLRGAGEPRFTTGA